MFLLGCQKSELQKMHESGKYNVLALEFIESREKSAYLTPSLLNPPFRYSYETNSNEDESTYYIVEDGDSILFNGIAYFRGIRNDELCEYDIGKFVNGKKEGLHRYYTCGLHQEILFEGRYINGKRTGLFKQKTSDISEINYKDGKRDGLYRIYNIEDSKLTREENYKNGQKHGLCKSFHSNGQLMNEVNYVQGKKDGEEKSYDQEGKQYSFRTYWKEGVRISKPDRSKPKNKNKSKKRSRD